MVMISTLQIRADDRSNAQVMPATIDEDPGGIGRGS
jgi:hypothetical protein